MWLFYGDPGVSEGGVIKVETRPYDWALPIPLVIRWNHFNQISQSWKSGLFL